MDQSDIDNMLDNSRQLIVTLLQPDGKEETYRYFVDTPAICTKIEGDEEEVVDFDFIPEWVTNAVWPLINPVK